MSGGKYGDSARHRRYAHLTVDELRVQEGVSSEEWFDELRARGILQPASDEPRLPWPTEPLLPPDALERFLEEREYGRGRLSNPPSDGDVDGGNAISDEKQDDEARPRPYAHLTVDELRVKEGVSSEEWFEELVARGIITPPVEGAKLLRPIAHRPGAVERFLRERC